MTTLRDKTVCVTGAGGFIGSALCRALLPTGAKVIALDNFSQGRPQNLAAIASEIEIVEADLLDLSSLKKPILASQIVFHLAALDSRVQCQQNFLRAVDINIKGTANLLSLCQHVERILYCSSAMVYGEPLYLPIDEQHPLHGVEPYASSKIAAEQLFKAHYSMHALPYTIVRNFNTYGPRQNPHSLIPSLIIEALTQGKIEVWTPSVTRDLQYVTDCAANLVAISEAESTRHEVLNLGTGHCITTGELAQLICDQLGTSWVSTNTPPPVSSKLVCSTEKINAFLQRPTPHTLNEGLKETIAFYQAGLERR